MGHVYVRTTQSVYKNASQKLLKIEDKIMAGNAQRQMQDEMERFEAEISRTSKPMIPSNLKSTSETFQPPQHYPKFFSKPSSVPSSTFFLPTQLQRAGVKPANPSAGFSSSSSQSNADQTTIVGAAVISNKPVLYLPEKDAKAVAPTNKTPTPVKKQKVEVKPPVKPAPSMQSTSAPSVLKAPSSTVGSATVKQGEEPKVVKYKKPKKFVRAAGGVVWQDDSLLDWDPSDFRIFCGDLGNDVTDEVLARVFGKFPSFQRAKVIRDKRSNKSKGFGFVSFKDPQDFTRAMKELNGKYVGSRPIKLRKSNWKNRNIEDVKKRQKEKDALMGKQKRGHFRNLFFLLLSVSLDL